MQLKVCGMCDMANILELVEVQPDWMGLIFFTRSPRFPQDLVPSEVRAVPLPKVGVFVNEPEEIILQKTHEWGLDAVQLHGEETWQTVRDLKASGLVIFKAIRVLDRLPDDLGDFVPYTDYFLFDTRQATAYGGTGEQFDWSILSGYHWPIPYLLSGGIGVEEIDRVKRTKLPGCIGIDINSRVEIKPGLKDIGRIKKIKEML